MAENISLKADDTLQALFVCTCLIKTCVEVRSSYIRSLVVALVHTYARYIIQVTVFCLLDSLDSLASSKPAKLSFPCCFRLMEYFHESIKASSWFPEPLLRYKCLACIAENAYAHAERLDITSLGFLIRAQR